MALMQYRDLGHTLAAEMHALYHWYVGVHPDGMVNPATAPQQAAMTLLNWPAASPPEQLQMGKQLLQMVHQIRAGQLGRGQ